MRFGEGNYQFVFRQRANHCEVWNDLWHRSDFSEIKNEKFIIASRVLFQLKLKRKIQWIVSAWKLSF